MRFALVVADLCGLSHDRLGVSDRYVADALDRDPRLTRARFPLPKVYCLNHTGMSDRSKQRRAAC